MTKRFLIILICALTFKYGLAQSRLSYSFDIAPIYSYRIYQLKDYSTETSILPSGEALFQYFEDYYNDIEKPGLGIGLAVGFHYKLSEKLAIKTGLAYKFAREKLLHKQIIGMFSAGGQMEPIYSDELVTQYNNYRYLSIPIEFNQKILKWNKSSLGLVAGSDFDFWMGHKIIELPDVSFNFLSNLKYEFADISKVAINLKGGIYLDYKIRNNLSVYIQPEFARYLTENISYHIQPYGHDFYSNINQYNYYGNIKFGIKI